MDAVAKPIKIMIKGSDNHGNDAPTVKDLLTQILDHLEILCEVETAIFGKGQEQLEWRVTNLTKNSPLSVEITPSPKVYGTNIDNRANEVVNATSQGFQELKRGGKRPKYFTDSILKKIEGVNKRVTNGLSDTEVDFSKYKNTTNFSINPNLARAIIKRIETLKTPTPAPYREMGSVEGYVKNIGHDGKRAFIILNARIDGRDIKCTSSDAGLDKIERLLVGEVIKGLRLRVFGILHYKVLGVIDRVDVDRVEQFTPRDQLPTIEDLIDHDFTNGVDSVEYIRRMRDNV